jgi:dTDP-4-amino-4,6-dideoxygalactose transaminase
LASHSALPLGPAPAQAAARLPVARPRLPAAEAILPYLERVDEARWYSNFGPLLTAFEARIADRFSPDAQIVTVANATQALTLALMAMDLPRGAYVAIPAWTFVATAHAVIQAGLQPWLLDVDETSWALDPAAVADLVARYPGEICAVIPVSPFGKPLDLEGWLAFREATGTPVLVDAAAGFDTACDVRLPHVVSLHATKVLGVGEGGFLATDDADFALKVRQLTTFGFANSRDSLIPATNAKLSEYAAAVGHAALDGWPADRLRFLLAAQHLRIGLVGYPDVQFQDGWGSDWVTSVCSVEVPRGRGAEIAAALGAQGIDTRQWWGLGCHASPAFATCRRELLPVTDRLARSVVGLPFAIDLNADEISRLAAALGAALAGR